MHDPICRGTFEQPWRISPMFIFPSSFVEEKMNTVKWLFSSPSCLGCLFGNFLAFLRREFLSPRLPAHAPERHGGGVFAVVRGHVLDLPRRDLGDHDGASV